MNPLIILYFPYFNNASSLLVRTFRDKGDQFGAVGESRLDLHLGDHLGDALHDIIAAQQGTAVVHQIGDTATIACALHDRSADVRHRLGIVEFQTAVLAPLGEQCRGEQQQFVFFSRGELHVDLPFA